VGYGKLDDLYDDRPKIKRAWRQEPAAVGLHSMSVSHCNRHQSDGVVDPEWLIDKLPRDRDRQRLLTRMVELGLFDFLPAGDTFALTDQRGNTITVGPFPQDRYVVHDFLDHNRSSIERTESRAQDRQRKRPGRIPVGNTTAIRSDSERNPNGIPPDSGRHPNGIQPESVRSPRARARASTTETETTLRPPQPPRRGGSGRQRDQLQAQHDYDTALQVFLEQHPCSPDTAPEQQQWRELVEQMDPSARTLFDASHAHHSQNGTLIVGVPPSLLSWVLKRAEHDNWRKAAFAGQHVELVACPNTDRGVSAA
jgi:hypothetical protein